jgi:hypothetical protein
MRGLVWEDLGDLTGEEVVTEEKTVGRFTSLVTTPTRRFGLAVLRREVLPGTALVAGGRTATVVALPFTPEPTAA